MAAKGPNITSSHYSIPMRKVGRGQKGFYSYISIIIIVIFIIVVENNLSQRPLAEFYLCLIDWIESLAMGKSSYNWTKTIIFIPWDCKKKIGVLLSKSGEGKSIRQSTVPLHSIQAPNVPSHSPPPLCTPTCHCSLLDAALSSWSPHYLTHMPRSGFGVSSLGFLPAFSVFPSYFESMTILFHNKGQS